MKLPRFSQDFIKAIFEHFQGGSLQEQYCIIWEGAAIFFAYVLVFLEGICSDLHMKEFARPDKPISEWWYVAKYPAEKYG